MRNILIIGTSHTTDKHYDYSPEVEAGNYYPNYNKGEELWTEYLCSKLSLNPINLAIGGFGIETYAARIHSVKEEYDIALIEMPNNARHELYIEQKGVEYKPNYLFENFWSDKLYKNEILKFNASDYDLTNVTVKKINRINKNAEIPIPIEDFKANVRNTARHNEHLQNDNIYATITLINGYLKSKKVLPIWFSYNFDIDNYNFDDFILVNKELNYPTFLDYVRFELGYKEDDMNYFGDGSHLNSKFWRNLVDDFFVDFIKRRI